MADIWSFGVCDDGRTRGREELTRVLEVGYAGLGSIVVVVVVVTLGIHGERVGMFRIMKDQPNTLNSHRVKCVKCL